MELAKYLGQNASSLLNSVPFKRWPVERWVDDESYPAGVGYVFSECGLQFNCDADTENIHSLYFEKEEHDGFVLSEVPFYMSREAVRARFGQPERSGDALSHPILGELGPWDRFKLNGFLLRIQYHCDLQRIEMVTLMRPDVAP